MHIQAIASEALSPARLLRQLRETASDTVNPADPSVRVSLSADGRLATLVDQLLGGSAPAFEAARLIGQASLFERPLSAVPLPAANDPASGTPLAAPPIGPGGLDPQRLEALLQGQPDALPLLLATLQSAGLARLFEASPGETAALPAGVRLYLDNGGIAGVRLEQARQPDLFAQPPLP